MRVLIVATLVLFSAAVLGAEWHVSAAGDDRGGDGSAQKPLRSIGALLNGRIGRIKSGDTVILHASGGRFDECDIRVALPLTLRSRDGERAHVHCDVNTPDSSVFAIRTGGSGTRISGLEISGAALYGIKLDTEWYRNGGESGKGASNVVLEDLKIHDTGRDAIKITPKANHITIRRSEIFNTGATYPPGTPISNKNAEGIDNVNGAHMLVEDNHIHHIATTGVYFKGGARAAIVQRNRIEHAGIAGILVGFDTSEEWFDPAENPHYFEAIDGIVRNNIVRDTGYAGIGLYAARNAVVVNNTLIDTAKQGHAAIYFGIPFQDWGDHDGRPPSEKPLVRNNLVIQPRGDCMAIRWSHELGGLSALQGSTGSDWNGFSTDPRSCRFSDGRPGGRTIRGVSLQRWRQHTGADGHSIETMLRVDEHGALAPDSAAIGAGTVLEQVSDDLNGRARGARNDLGARQAVLVKPSK